MMSSGKILHLASGGWVRVRAEVPVGTAVVVHTCNPNALWGLKLEDGKFKASLGYVSESLF